MPRNSSGTMTRAKGPYVAGTVISSSDVNSEMSDIAAEISDSASRSGKGGFTAPIRGADGTAGAPTHSFTADTDSGVYSKGANNPAMAVGGNEKQEWTAAGSKVTGAFEATGAVTAGAQVNLGSVTSDPASPADGALWYRSDTDKFKARANAATQSLATEAYVDNATPLLMIAVASTATILQQKGRITATVGHGFVGRYQVSVPGATANHIAVVSAKGGRIGYSTFGGADTIEVYVLNPATFALTDEDFTMVVWAL